MSHPLSIGTDAQFACVREYLERLEYTEPIAADRIGFRRLDQIGMYELCDQDRRARNLSVRDPLNVVVKLFLCGQAVAIEEYRELTPELVRAAFEALGLVEQNGDSVVSPVLLYPSFGLHLVSDRYMNPDGSNVETGSDFVYLVLQRSGSDFMDALPRTRCEGFLDMGTGCGVAALWAAKNGAAHAWGVDLGARAVHYAEFNRRLNGIANVTILQGDMYQPVHGMEFDRIVMHPPYAIGSVSSKYLYADGGEDGEDLTRRMLAGATEHLKPGGLAGCMTTGTDRIGAPLEQRMRQWLGERHAEFDCAVLVREPIETDQYAIATIAATKGHLREMKDWRERFARLRVERLTYGDLWVQRHRYPGQAAFTLRRTRSAETTSAAVDWMLAWESAAAQAKRNALLLESRARANSRAELRVRHKMADGKLDPVEYSLYTLAPFDTVMTCKPWVAFLFSRCNGTRTGAELLAELSKNLPAGLNAEQFPEHFLDGLSAMISGGFVDVDGFRLPA